MWGSRRKGGGGPGPDCGSGPEVRQRRSRLFLEARRELLERARRLSLDGLEEALAVAVHGYEQGPEVPDPKAPQALGQVLLELDPLDGLDLGRLECR